MHIPLLQLLLALKFFVNDFPYQRIRYPCHMFYSVSISLFLCGTKRCYSQTLNPVPWETGKRRLWKQHISVLELCNRNLEGGLLYWGLWKTCQRRLWKCSIQLYIQRLNQGNMVGGLLYWDYGNLAFLFIGAKYGKPKDVNMKDVQNILQHSIFSNVLHNSLIIFIG
jgi:hypothetical protein